MWQRQETVLTFLRETKAGGMITLAPPEEWGQELGELVLWPEGGEGQEEEEEGGPGRS